MKLPIVDLRGLPASVAVNEMWQRTSINPLERIDRLFCGEVPGVFRRFAGTRMVIVLTGACW